MKTVSFFFVAQHDFHPKVGSSIELNEREVLGCSFSQTFAQAAGKARKLSEIGAVNGQRRDLEVIRVVANEDDVFAGFFAAMVGDAIKNVNVKVEEVIRINHELVG